MLLQLARAVKCILAGNEYVTYICATIQQRKSAEKELVFSKCCRFYRREWGHSCFSERSHVRVKLRAAEAVGKDSPSRASLLISVRQVRKWGLSCCEGLPWRWPLGDKSSSPGEAGVSPWEGGTGDPHPEHAHVSVPSPQKASSWRVLLKGPGLNHGCEVSSAPLPAQKSLLAPPAHLLSAAGNPPLWSCCVRVNPNSKCTAWVWINIMIHPSCNGSFHYD